MLHISALLSKNTLESLLPKSNERHPKPSDSRNITVKKFLRWISLPAAGRSSGMNPFRRSAILTKGLFYIIERISYDIKKSGQHPLP